jgi:hypothetical protein
MKNKNWSLLAGLYLGDGCIHIATINSYGTQIGYRLDMHVTVCDEEIVKMLVREFGGVYYHGTQKDPRWNDFYRWQPKGMKNKEEILLGMIPHLVGRKLEAAKCALEFCRMRYVNNPEARKELASRCRQFTKRGKSVETNTLNPEKVKIESELQGDLKSTSLVTAIV